MVNTCQRFRFGTFICEKLTLTCPLGSIERERCNAQLIRIDMAEKALGAIINTHFYRQSDCDLTCQFALDASIMMTTPWASDALVGFRTQFVPPRRSSNAIRNVDGVTLFRSIKQLI